jgi:hypothetical protein
MLLFKPNSISSEEAFQIHKKIKMINYIFAGYKKTISYVFKKAGEQCILGMIYKNIAVDFHTEAAFTPDRVNGILLEVLDKTGLLDTNILVIIIDEYKEQKICGSQQKATPQIWLEYIENVDCINTSQAEDTMKDVRNHGSDKLAQNEFVIDFNF